MSSNNRSNNLDTMHNRNPDINFQPYLDTSNSSVKVRLSHPSDPDTAPTKSDMDGSVDSQAKRPKCTIKVKFGSVWEKQSITEVATIKVTQDDFHECRAYYTVDPVKQRRIKVKTRTITRVWSRAGGCVTFELEVREKKQPPQLFGPLTEAKTREYEQHLKRKRGDP